MESKSPYDLSESKDDILVERADLDIESFIEYCQSKEFKNVIDSFRYKYESLFDSAHDSKHPEYDQSHERFEAFQEYQKLLDELFEKFARKYNTSINHIYSGCRDIVDGKFTPLFEEHPNQWFVEVMFSFLEYDEFFRLMTNKNLCTSNGK
jgi:hypothetical protein